MDWYPLQNKRMSFSGAMAPPNLQQPPPHVRYPMPSNYTTASENLAFSGLPKESRASHYASQYPLFCADWISGASGDLVALGSFREGFQNRIQVLGGTQRANDEETDTASNLVPNTANSAHSLPENGAESVFDFSLVAETPTDYPVTALQWQPQGHDRFAASSDVLRLFHVSQEHGEPSLVQTHMLAANTAGSIGNNTTGNPADSDFNTLPPVTGFDWNLCDPMLMVTLSVDTTCTVWDLSRLRAQNRGGLIKTQLIAHDLEVFDVKFMHMSADVFASVLNDGLMRVFDLRLLEHSTISYEHTARLSTDGAAAARAGASYNLRALVRLLASHTDQHTLATVGVHLNEVYIIDLRMPGGPVVILDGLFDGQNSAAINLIQWHPSANLLATGGDDCQALIWDCSGRTGHRTDAENRPIIDTPVLAYSDDLEVNSVCWQRDTADWMGVVSGKGFQALQTL